MRGNFHKELNIGIHGYLVAKEIPVIALGKQTIVLGTGLASLPSETPKEPMVLAVISNSPSKVS